MQQVAEYVVAHAAQFIEVLAALFLVIVAIIALTPRKDDDDALRGFLASLSPTAKKAIGGGALAGVLALVAALLGGCGGSSLRTHVSIAEGLDAAITADAVAYEQRLATATVEGVIRTCTEPDGFEECRDGVARSTADKFERWESAHDAAASARDLYVAALRESTAEDVQLKRLRDEALEVLARAVQVAMAFGANIDIARLLELAR